MTSISAASRGYRAARAACRKAQGLYGVGNRRNVASIQSCPFLATRNEPSIADYKTETGTSNTSWRGISHWSNNDGVSPQQSSNDELSEMSPIRLIGAMPIFEEDDGG
uniref:Uncharacterized protein n=1 Tax=Pseudo-nitzschia delicatissima TaxID=44447 RepID=A0A6T9ZU51_9STRA|mmetsp:Transcript_4278/g.8902  ORF Transcript_4278/g.8902 Transcript_4278/m.8902 type:complete len:108 (+) Transcript_4278:156-479(+)|eukprot:CAMPEP_0197272734 /NCGR_PEP_ID=MMETSP1432-20130617/10299_1 /TAXON_ID=44447 /ORGANISM="Pseudo-nitzschia delicatissima, Strain UNC1205" /LENGTH=107 /DNA_ID=CAMNT_0042738307 /DNA_START=79 /DNA_END=402 /DNA_ORIENTATION=+